MHMQDEGMRLALRSLTTILLALLTFLGAQMWFTMRALETEMVAQRVLTTEMRVNSQALEQRVRNLEALEYGQR